MAAAPGTWESMPLRRASKVSTSGGTPLRLWPGAKASGWTLQSPEVATTVEELASAPGSGLHCVREGRSLLLSVPASSTRLSSWTVGIGHLVLIGASEERHMGTSSNAHCSGRTSRSSQVILASPDIAIFDNSFVMPMRIPSAIRCRPCMWSKGTSSSARSVTSACMPMRNQMSSPVRLSFATLRPRTSKRLRKSSPDFFRFGMTAVYGAPVRLDSRNAMRSAGSMSQPWFRNRQLTPRISFLWKPVRFSNSSETAMRGQSFARGSAMVTTNLHSATAASMLCLMRTSVTTAVKSLSMLVH
mmetsp:Transcript_33271/g.84189  ORF Transcript_33271/g.84189 Transcript_33271/m.84189 type:complete len:301 (+) Transcript_33271:143-1045(+)